MRLGFKKIALVAVISVLAACSSKAPTHDVEGDVNTLYNKAMDQMGKEEFVQAIHTFEELERQHPYSGWATQAHLNSAYAMYRVQNYDEAIANLDRFIRLHPGHKDLPYVYYLKALAYYDRISDVHRDQGDTLKALEAFREVRRRFPESEYARDARFKITLCLDHLAGQEMMVGRYYQEYEKYLAAANRFRTVIEKYQTSTQTPEALYRLTESYLALGIHQEAQEAAAVLGHNFPASDWYKEAYELLQKRDLEPTMQSEGSWMKDAFDSVKEIF